MKVLVTGGAGYIGSHTVVELLNAGHDVVVADNLSNSSQTALKRVEQITGKQISFHEIDIGDKAATQKLFTSEKPDAVIHFAGLKAVGESVEKPLLYYQGNVTTTLNLLEIMAKNNVKKMVFSSSATVYGSADYPYKETSLVGQDISSPYGQTKYVIENILRDVALSNESFQFVALRYFNPVGAHPSGLIGEDPKGVPNNLMPYVAQVASGKREFLNIWGNDYDTVDGTGVRDYLHVVDLAKGHVSALSKLRNGFDAFNLGSGKGTSVLQLVAAFEKACGKKIPYKIGPRRNGDLPEYFADANKAAANLGWKTEKSIDDMCRDAWNWQSKNPNGYAS